MLLIHQAGSVKVGEVVRYTLTYTPSADRILPSPANLHVRIKNTSAIPYRAAYLHGPYTLHVSTYPVSFNPNAKLEQPRRDGIPEFEPNLKAGGHFHSKLVVPEDIREHGEKPTSGQDEKGTPKSMTWIIEIASQILFSNNASVSYDIIVGRDERSLELGFAAIAAKGYGGPGRLEDQSGGPAKPGDHTQIPKKGVYSGAVDLVIEDTATLWNKPALPTWDDLPPGKPAKEEELPKIERKSSRKQKSTGPDENEDRPQKKIHLVVLTHGLHSNIGADMLYMKESIDATAREARQRSKNRRGSKADPSSDGQDDTSSDNLEPTSTAPLSGGQDEIGKGAEDDPDDEQVIVRGFTGNATRTERGIQYLGKRLAKFILSMTYPDQPFLPVSKSLARSMTGSFSAAKSSMRHGTPAHAGSSVFKTDGTPKRRPYKFTSISFIGHSLGGLIQMYAVAYIQKHSPGFFDTVKPINFIAMATPLLGLSNENPMYVKFALDFGLVGRTGQDLGLTWRAPTLARNGWSSMLASFGAGNNQQQPKEADPRAKPLLRILPTGPAHQVLKQFRNRTVYSNVVNDGIVPLRTSCLLFLDWRGLGRVENARRENGLLATLASTGWAELTGANSVSHRPASSGETDEEYFADGNPRKESTVSDQGSLRSKNDFLTPNFPSRTEPGSTSPQPSQFLEPQRAATSPRPSASGSSGTSDSRPTSAQSLLDQFFSFFKPAPTDPSHGRKLSNKAQRTYRRAQIVRKDSSNREEHSAPPTAPSAPSQDRTQKAQMARGSSFEGAPPPKTSVFDAAADILSPPIPPLNWLLDPSTRDRTIFHDRVYHPEDIPPPPMKRSKLGKSFSSDSLRRPSNHSMQSDRDSTEIDTGTMRVEEKIARAYHHNISWRKVLVRLEPDAHNNMIVRRMFANAYGWDVVKHLCDTHFSDSFSSNTRDDEESNVERALPVDEPTSKNANQVRGQTDRKNTSPRHTRTKSELMEVDDEIKELVGATTGINSMSSKASTRKDSTSSVTRQDSAVWDDRIFEGSDSDADSDGEDQARGPLEVFQRYWNGNGARPASPSVKTEGLSVEPKIASQLTASPSAAEPPQGIGSKDAAGDVLSSAFQAASIGKPLEAEKARVDGGNEAVRDGQRISGDITELGLRKNAEDATASLKPDEGKGGIVEEVARAAKQ
ncbi:hypothetical protein FH972_021762 [Carpinus fangiana]|uniref:DUF676 domain-containing protein n=1 Tax=Carpinus fangiana TaxID=176857 RepID=A0A5N6KQM3_9ROSI|nr:hypothetical protein FH972_021762 [Carpinus fangiana]